MCVLRFAGSNVHSKCFPGINTECKIPSALPRLDAHDLIPPGGIPHQIHSSFITQADSFLVMQRSFITNKIY